MTGIPFLQPDYTSQSGSGYPVAIDNAIAVFRNVGRAFNVSAQANPNMTVAIDQGFTWNGGVVTTVGAQTSTTIPAPTTNSRYDIVYVDEVTGVAGIQIGTESAIPGDPVLVDGLIPLARIRSTPGMGSITNSIVDDLRPGMYRAGGGVKGNSIPSAATLPLPGVGDYFQVTGTANISAISQRAAGRRVLLEFAASLTLINGPTLILSGGSNIQTQNGDLQEFVSEGAGVWRQKSGSGGTGLPAGVLMPFAGTVEPPNWMLCDGRAISRTTYVNLFQVLGTAYGAGDGSTTFNIPDLRGRVPAGSDNMGTTAGDAARLGTGASGGFGGAAVPGAGGGEKSHTLSTGEMPSHTHSLNGIAIINAGSLVGLTATGGAPANPLTNATGGGGAHNNVQPTLVMNYIIYLAGTTAVVTPPPGGGGGGINPPVAAQANGYTTLAFGEEFNTAPDIGFDNNPHKWWAGIWYGAVPDPSQIVWDGVSTLKLTNTEIGTISHDTVHESFRFRGGYLEARLKCTNWSGIWMLSLNHIHNVAKTTDPTTWCCEIDVLETDQYNPDHAFCAIHRNTSGFGQPAAPPDEFNMGLNNNDRYMGPGFGVIGSWHTYAYLWLQNLAEWYIDGVKVLSIANPYASLWQDCTLITNAWPGGWGSNGVDPIQIEIDWIRFWQ